MQAPSQTSATPDAVTAREVAGHDKKNPTLSATDVAASALPWTALKPEEQVEHLRLVIRGQDRQLAELRGVMHALMRHQHGADGRMVVPLVFGDGREAVGEAPDPAQAWL